MHDIISIDVHIGDDVHVTKYFDIVRSSNNQSKLDSVTFDLDIGARVSTQLNLSLELMTNASDAISLQLSVDTHTLNAQMGAIYGGIILISLNVLIISEVISLLIIQKGNFTVNHIHLCIDRWFIERWPHCWLHSHRSERYQHFKIDQPWTTLSNGLTTRHCC